MSSQEKKKRHLEGRFFNRGARNVTWDTVPLLASEPALWVLLLAVPLAVHRLYAVFRAPLQTGR